MEVKNKRKQPEASISIHITINIPPSTPTDGNSDYLRSKSSKTRSAKKCLVMEEVSPMITSPFSSSSFRGRTSVKSSKMKSAKKCLVMEEVLPVKISHNDEKLVGEKKRMIKMKRFRPKVMTPEPIIPSPFSSSSFRGRTSVKSSKMKSAKKCLVMEEVLPVKLSRNNNDDEELVGEKKRMIKMKKFRPKVMTPEPITPSPFASSSFRGRTSVSVKSSCRRALDFDAQAKPMLVYTKGGHCFTRRVNKYMEGLECNSKEEDKNEEEEVEELFRQRALSFITAMRHVQGNRGFMGWKGSVLDSIVGVFLTQNAADSLSSSAFMCLAAKYLIGDPTEGISNKHALDWNAVRCAQPYEISHVIQERGMNNRIAARIQAFLGSIYNHKSGLLDDLEWLRKAKPEKTMEFFSKIYGLGIKSMDCLRLLTLRQQAFPVDRHVARIVVRLGWVPIEKLPDGVLIHELKEYPMMEAVQEYLSHRLSNLDVDTLYELHYQMITFGKVFCTKKKPNCNSCPLKKECKHFASAFGSTRKFSPQGVLKTFVPRTPTCGQSSSHGKVRIEEDIEDLFKVHPVIKVMKNAAGRRLRTEHQVYELPDSHPLVQQLEKREEDDKNPYLLAIWPRAAGKDKGKEEDVIGRFLVPCRTATRGSFPLDGTFFQINEVFADDESCKKPVIVPRYLLSDLTIKTLFCGTSISAIFQGLSSEEIRDCFWKGYVCIRSFSMKSRTPGPLPYKFHPKTSRVIKYKHKKLNEL